MNASSTIAAAKAKPRKGNTARTPTTTSWQNRAVMATQGSRFGAIICCALDRKLDGHHFSGKASITSDGFVMCNFTDSHGCFHHGAFVGAASDLDHNVAGLTHHLNLNDEDAAAFKALIAGWIGTDYRPNKVAVSRK